MATTVKLMKTLGYSVGQIARGLRCSVSVLYHWANNYPSFKRALETPKRARIKKWKQSDRVLGNRLRQGRLLVLEEPRSARKRNSDGDAT